MNAERFIEFLIPIIFSITIGSVIMWIIIPQIFKWFIFYNPRFYCQRQIEGRSKCTQQCEHCKEYYQTVENL